MSDPAIDELWSKVLASWDDDQVHAAFTEYCRLSGALGRAATCYRAELAATEDPARRARAEKRLKSIAAMALLEIDAARTAEAPADLQVAHKLTRWAVVIFFVGALLVLSLILAR